MRVWPRSRMLTGALLGLTALSLHCAEVGEFCHDVGPPCGLTVDFDGGNLDVGTYTVAIDSSAGLTSCDYVVETPTHQTQEEAEEADQALIDCQEDDSCGDDWCTGPETVYLRSSSLTIDGDSASITITIENVDTGAESSKVFSPSYVDHPEDCADCVTAADSMPLPALGE